MKFTLGFAPDGKSSAVLILNLNLYMINLMFLRIFTSLIFCFSWVSPVWSVEIEELTCQDIQAFGQINVLDFQSPFIIAAPHGKFDKYTEIIAQTLCEDLNWSCLLALGFRNHGQELNVNRPTKGVGLPSKKELWTQEARQVYTCYRFALQRLMPLQFRTYIEIHGNSREATKHVIEIAQKGFHPEQLKVIKTKLQAFLIEEGFNPEILQVKIESLDKIHYVGSGLKRFGVLSELEQGLMVELPRWVRHDPKERARLMRALMRTFRLLEGHSPSSD